MKVLALFKFRSAALAVTLFAVLFAFTGPAGAEDDYSEVTDSLVQGQALFAKSLAAFGGRKQLASISSMTHVIRIEIDGAEGRLAVMFDSLIQVFPDKEARSTRSDSSALELWTVVNGDDAWRIRNGSLEELTRPQIIVQRKAFEGAMFNLLAMAKQPHYEVRFAGSEVLEDKPVLRLDFKTSSGYEFSWFLNPETYLPIGASVALDRLKGMYYFDSYREYDGIQVGRAMRLIRNGRTINIITDTALFDAPYDTAIFSRPQSNSITR